MKRRNFLRMTAPVAFSPLVLDGNILKPFMSASLNKMFNCEDVNDRVLVVVQMKGGNDGLNCVVPTNQYDMYKSFRPTIGTDLNKLLTLDSSLSNQDQVSLHPNLASFKALYEKDAFAVVQAVGYANSNKSHFKGTDLWLSGGDSTPQNYNLGSGWIGRYLEASYPGLPGEPTDDFPDPLGIQLGSKQQFLGFHTEEQHEAGINLSGQDPGGFYSLISELGGIPPSVIPVSDYGHNLDYVIDVEKSTSKYSNRVSQVFNQGTNLGSYDADVDLSNQLKTVARMISGGSKTKIYVVTIGSFDTHNVQADGTTPEQGTHATLLESLSNSILAFQNDLELMGLDNRVAGVTFSEFGRRPKENGSKGTDHGTIAPMFLFGTPIKSGVFGTNADLSLIGDGNDLIGMQHDYRSVFTALLQDWLGASDNVLESTLFEPYISSKTGVIENNYLVSPDCYIDTYLSTSIFNRAGQLKCYPNPTTQAIFMDIELSGQGTASLKIYDMKGQLQKVNSSSYVTGINKFEVLVANFESGAYIVQVSLSGSRRNYTGRFVKM